MNENPNWPKSKNCNMVGSFFNDEIHILCSALPDVCMLFNVALGCLLERDFCAF